MLAQDVVAIGYIDHAREYFWMIWGKDALTDLQRIFAELERLVMPT